MGARASDYVTRNARALEEIAPFGAVYSENGAK